MKLWQACLNYTWALETFRIVRQNEIYAGWIFRIFIAFWFLNKTFEVMRITENRHITIIHAYIEIT